MALCEDGTPRKARGGPWEAEQAVRSRPSGVAVRGQLWLIAFPPQVTNHGHRPWHEEGPPEGAVYVR
jgi:hypothetical protein